MIHLNEGMVQYRLADLPQVAKWLLEQFGEHYQVWLFEAPMGAGKTTLITEIARQAGAIEEGSSPTFAIVNVYPTKDGDELYHMDCYRIEQVADAEQLGLGEYLESGARCFVEWPEVLGHLIPEGALEIQIELVPDDEGTRLLTISKR